MIYRRTERFKKAFQLLPGSVQEKAAKAFVLFQRDPNHPSLGVKKIQGHPGVWEGRVDYQHRFSFHYETDPTTGQAICIFRNIDNHDECLKKP